MAYSPYYLKRSAEIPLRQSIRNRLQALGYALYSGSAPNNAAYPHIVLDYMTESEFCTKLAGGSEIVVKIDVYAKETGVDTATLVKDEIIQALNEPLQITDWQVSYHALDSPGSITFKESPLISHAAIYVRFKLTYTG